MLNRYFIFMAAFDTTILAQHTLPSIEFSPRSYVCYKISDSLNIDGKPDEQSWQQVTWSDKFLDIEGRSKPVPRYETRVKMLWDENYFYVAARLEDPHVWATLTQRDTVIFYNNDFEVFLDPDGDTHQYYELEVNAFGTFWDLMLTQPYRDAGQAIDAWDIRGLKVGVDVNGSLNDPSDIDSGWTVELALPWEVLEEAAPGGQKPSVGDQWRINFSRVQWEHTVENGKYRKALNPETNQPFPENNWVWSPQGVVNMHYPEMWGYVQFADQNASFEWRHEEQIKWYLRQLYYRQHNHKKQFGSFTSDADVLQAEKAFEEQHLSNWFPDLSLPEIYATQETFEIRMRDEESGQIWYIRENGRVWSTESSE
jgi:hypothetical protein